MSASCRAPNPADWIEQGKLPGILKKARKDHHAALLISKAAKAGQADFLVEAGAIGVLVRGPSAVVALKSRYLAGEICRYHLEALAEIALKHAPAVVRAGGIGFAMKSLMLKKPIEAVSASAALLAAISRGGCAADVQKAGAPAALLGRMRDPKMIKPTLAAIKDIMESAWAGFMVDNGALGILEAHYTAGDSSGADNAAREAAMDAICDIAAAGKAAEIIGRGCLERMLFNLSFDPDTIHDYTYTPDYGAPTAAVLRMMNGDQLAAAVDAGIIPILVRRLKAGYDDYWTPCAREALLRLSKAGYDGEVEAAGGHAALNELERKERESENRPACALCGAPVQGHARQCAACGTKFGGKPN